MIAESSRLKGVEAYYFSSKLKEIAQRKAQGEPIINLGIGSPDLPPSESVIKELQNQSENEGAHGYQAYRGIPELRNSFAEWYRKYFQVNPDPENEILPMMGSKEGIMHLSMAYLDPGDYVLVPDPSYPTYSVAARLAGATPYRYRFSQTKVGMPDFDRIPSSILDKSKILWMNYPHMPTGILGSEEIFAYIRDFAKTNNLLLVNDNPYVQILNPRPLSILSDKNDYPGICELTSLSKSYNMAGWRIGALTGSKEIIDTVLKFKSNMDSGMFKPIQLAASVALSQGKAWIDSLNEIYSDRKKIGVEIIGALGCKIEHDQGGFFIWARIPESVKDGIMFSEQVLNNKMIFVCPGSIFGPSGELYIRLSLCSKKEELKAALHRINT